MAISASSISVFSQPLARLFGMAAALFLISTLGSQRADAFSPANPGNAAAGKAAIHAMTIEVRGGHGGGGGGGGSGASFGGGRGFSGAAVRSGGFSTGPAVVSSAGHAVIPGGGRFVGHGFAHRRFGRAFVGAGVVYYDDYTYDYPQNYSYDDGPEADYPAAVQVVPVVPTFVGPGGCRITVTVYGPRVVCHHRAARHYRAQRRHHYRKHHRA